MLPPPKPIPLSERAAMVFVERAQIDVKDGAFVAIDAEGMRTGSVANFVVPLQLDRRYAVAQKSEQAEWRVSKGRTILRT